MSDCFKSLISRIKNIILFLFHLISHSVYSSISWLEQIISPLSYDDVYFMLDQHAGFDLYSAIALAQQSTNRHMAPLGQNILTPTSLSCLLSVSKFVLYMYVVIVPHSNNYMYMFLQSFRNKYCFIATEMPQCSTIVDFCRMIFQEEVRTIVMLDNESTGINVRYTTVLYIYLFLID